MPETMSSDIRCPVEREWDELAAGITLGEPADRLIEHASTCATCAVTLRDALEVFAEAEPAVLVMPSHRSRNWWPMVAVAAGVVLAVGGWWRFKAQPDPLNQLAAAYSDRRTIELRVPGSAHGPLRVARSGAGAALTNQSPDLLEVAARVGRQLRETPSSPNWLHAKGRLALLEWKPAEAIESLQAARDLGAPEPDITIDLATAYFERAEQKGAEGAADLTLAQEFLSRVIRRDPRNTVALFNRALVSERIHQIEPAIADLEALLQTEKSAAWKKEAQERLERLKRLRTAFFDRDPSFDRKHFVEAALDLALEHAVNHEDSQATAQHLLALHGDPWLGELAALRPKASLDKAFRQLATLASIRLTSTRGRYLKERENMQGLETSLLPGPLAVWRDFELAYRATHSNGAFPCAAAPDVAALERRHYAWLAAQMEREAAICVSLKGEIQQALVRSKRAVRIAQMAHLPISEVRNDSIDAALEYRQGHYREVLLRQTALLGRIVAERLPVARSHEPFHNVVVATAALGRYEASRLAAAMATRVAESVGFQSAQFADRINGADAALRSGDRIAAEGLYREALRFHDAASGVVAPPSARAWAQIVLADLDGRTTLPAATTELLAASNDPFVRLPHERLRARQEAAAGAVEAAAERLQRSLLWLVESKRQQTHQVWRQEFQLAADQLLRLLVGRSNPAESFDWVQRLLELDERGLRTGPVRHANWRPDAVFSLRSIGEELIVWRQTGNRVELRVSQQPLEEAVRSIRRLRRLAGTPESSPLEIRAEGRRLTTLVFGKWLEEIQPRQKLLFQGEGMLAEIPFGLLMAGDLELARGHMVALTRSRLANQEDVRLPIGPVARLLVDATHVASLGKWNLPALPSPTAEVVALRQLPGRLDLLEGTAAMIARLHGYLPAYDFLHFSGHAVAHNGTIGLLLNDGVFELRDTVVPASVILSACSTGRSYQDETDTLSAATLAHAFILAGAAEVLASSWNLDTEAASAYMRSVYTAMAAGQDLSTATLAATRQLAAQSNFSHPYYWAGQLVLIRG